MSAAFALLAVLAILSALVQWQLWRQLGFTGIFIGIVIAIMGHWVLAPGACPGYAYPCTTHGEDLSRVFLVGVVGPHILAWWLAIMLMTAVGFVVVIKRQIDGWWPET